MSNTRNDIAKRLGLVQPKTKMGRAEKVMTDGSVHLDFKEAKEWLSSVSDDSLKYIISDANAAAKAMGADGKKFNYYTDLALTAGQILRSTKRGGHRLNSSLEAKSSRPGAKAKFAVIYSDSAPGDPQVTPRQYPRRVEVHFAIGKTDFLYSVKYFENGKLIGVHENLSREKALEDAKSFIRAGHRYSRPGAKTKFLRIDPNSINSWEIQRGRKITSAGKGTWAFTDPYGKLVIVPILGTFKEAVAWLNKNGDYKGSNDYYKVEMSRPGAKAKFETYPSDEAAPTGQGIPQSAKDLEESIAFLTDRINRLKKGLLAYPKALSKASGYEKESLLHQLERQKNDIKNLEKDVLTSKALLAKLKSNPDMNRINGKGRLMKLQRSVRPGVKVK
jgi:hypothetical protein